MKRIYFDNAATTPVTKEAFGAMLPYFSDKFGNADSVHSFGREAAAALDRARAAIASIIGVRRPEVYFTSGGTEANNLAITGIAEETGAGNDKKRIITSVIEHASVLAAVGRAEKLGFGTACLRVDGDGAVAPEELEKTIGDDVALVSVMAVNNETGVIQPVRELAEIAHAHGALFHTDAVQAYREDLADIASFSDMLTLSAHKFGGPKGAGALFIRGGVKINGIIIGGEQERGLRGGTSNVPAAAGFAAALSENEKHRLEERERMRALCALFSERVAEAGGIRFNGRADGTGIVNVFADGIEDSSLLDLLDMRGVCCSAGAACSSGSPEPSHVLRAMGYPEGRVRGSVRISFGAQTTRADVEEGAERFVGAVKSLRKIK